MIEKPVFPHPERNDQHEARIQVLEQALGISTPDNRLLEASLLIDGHFIETALVLGRTDRIERMFGSHEWKSHLEARLYAQSYGAGPLTIDFITGLHQIYLQGIGRGGQPSIIDSKDPRGGAVVNGKLAPLYCRPEEIEAMASNRFITWHSEPDDLLKGIIHYNVKSRHERIAALQDICDWYNHQVRLPENEGYLAHANLAGQLQHRIVSLHPLAIDYNGRVSRQVMNWSLTTSGISPSVLRTPDEDLFTDESSWNVTVWGGTRRYLTHQRQAEAGTLLRFLPLYRNADLLREYVNTYHPAVAYPTQLPEGSWLDHNHHRHFLNQLHLGLSQLDYPQFEQLWQQTAWQQENNQLLHS